MISPLPQPVMAHPPLRIFDRIHSGYIAHAVTDRGCMPLIEPGEVAVVTDQPLLHPESGGWYLVEYTCGKNFHGHEKRVRCISVAILTPRGQWYLKSPSGRHAGISECADGPYVDDRHLAEKVLGEVIGIYRPSAAWASTERLGAMLQ